jgi:hypothetical protein
MNLAGQRRPDGASVSLCTRAALRLALILAVGGAGEVWADVYVTPQGDDANPGSERAPVRTLERARDIVRVQRRALAAGRGDLSVWMHGGRYEMQRTLQLGVDDSGSPTRRIVYRALQARDRPIIAGASGSLQLRRLNSEDLRDAVAPRIRERLWAMRLPATVAYDSSQAQSIGVGLAAAPAPPELSCGPSTLEYVRSPRSGWYSIRSVVAVSTAFTADVNISRWGLASAWLHGYWGHEWADALVAVLSSDATTGMIVTRSLPPGLLTYTSGSRWQLVNAPGLLGAPGEYFMDFEHQLAYLVMPEDCRPEALTVSTLTQPLISVTQTRYLSFEGLDIGMTRGDGMVIANAEHVMVSGCTVHDVGGTGITITGGRRNRVRASRLFRIGRSAILVGGGDRATLTPARHRIAGNDIHDYGRWVGAYSAGVDVYGVGMEIAGNRIHAAPHTAIKLSGNDHVVEDNEVFAVARDTGDVGAIYAGRDLFMRGNIIRRNYLHDNGGGIPGGVSGVYLDDMFSGVTVESNVFVRTGQCVFIGGGRDNTVTANLFVGCEPAVHLDDRGVTTHAALARQPRRQGGWGLLDDRPHYLDSALYVRKYPALGSLAGERALEPFGNRIAGNFVAGTAQLTNVDAPLNASWFILTGNRAIPGLSASADTDTIRRRVAGVPALGALHFGAQTP